MSKTHPTLRFAVAAAALFLVGMGAGAAWPTAQASSCDTSPDPGWRYRIENADTAPNSMPDTLVVVRPLDLEDTVFNVYTGQRDWFLMQLTRAQPEVTE